MEIMFESDINNKEMVGGEIELELFESRRYLMFL